jgi:MFS family permease
VYSVAGALLMERWRRHWDDDRNPGAAAQTNMLTGVVVLWRYAILRYLAMAGFFFSFVQHCLGSFTVNLLVQEGGYGLVAAGAMLSLVQVAGMAGRLVFGWLADRSGRAIAALVVSSLIAAVGCIASMFISGSWPVPALAAFYVLFGMVAYGWNGVMHAQIARLSPPGMVSVATGGMMVWIFGGILVGPALFAATYRWIGSYTTTFGILALVAVASAVLAALAVRAERAA